MVLAPMVEVMVDPSVVMVVKMSSVEMADETRPDAPTPPAGMML